jgi:putative transposase
MAKVAAKPIDPKVLDELVAGVQNSEDFKDLLKQLNKGLLERVLEAEMTHHLGHEVGGAVTNVAGNTRNGKGKKKVQGDFGQIELDIPRDRQASFEPLIVPKHQRLISGMDDKILALYAKGMSTRDIESSLQELYEVEISPTLISQVTDAVREEVKLWQMRPLDELYPVVYLDCIFVKLRHEGVVKSQAVFVAIGLNLDGNKDVLGLWIERSEGATFWLGVLNDLKNRGLEDVFIFCVDGLKGFPEAIEAVYPQSQVQLCIVHLLRNSLNYVPWKDRKELAADLKAIYNAPNEQAAEQALTIFEQTWNPLYPSVAQVWRRHWQRIIPLFNYPIEIRKAIYTTNVIESLNYSLKKVVKTRGAFPDEDSLFKVLYLAIKNVQKKWTMPIRDWRRALNWFATLFGDRLTIRLDTRIS